MKRAFKYLICLLLGVTLLLCDGAAFQSNAATGSITVTNALNGELLYSGQSLKEAFAAATRGSIVSIDRFVTMTADAVLDVEVMLTNQDRLTLGDYKILLTGSGALYVESRLRKKNYGALYEYSTVEVTEESGGFVYYLETKAPSFDGVTTQITPSGKLYGARVEEAAGTVLLDAAVGGIDDESFVEMVSMPALYAQTVKLSLSGGKVANGATLTATASNPDYQKKVTNSYTTVLLGDVNGNGEVDAADAYLIACHVSGSMSLSGAALQAADADQNGAVTAADADLICKKYVRRDSYTTPLG